MSAMHTPGPWVPRASKFGLDFGIVINGEFVIAEVFSDIRSERHRDVEEARANARLIAAAPELLEALRTTRGNVASLGPAGAIPFEYREWLAMLDAAIAKATGAASC
ncbi:MAG TPA: hypothetical protein PLB26_19850 [Rubrivivax sp.]|nr:hypothetical protein [Rubrivivax sp.]